MKNISRMAKLSAALAALASVGAANAAITHWLTQAQNTAGNVTADSTGWTFDGTAGVSYDYGALDALEGKAVNGSTVEYIFNFSDSGASIALGGLLGWSPGNEKNVMKLEQWNNTGKFGITAIGVIDSSLSADSIFNEDVHVIFRRNGDSGTMDLFVNGAYITTDTNKTNWRMDGGVGILGANFDNNADFATGDMFGVASYDVALSNTEIANLYSAYAVAVPEPGSAALLGLGGLALILRRRK